MSTMCSRRSAGKHRLVIRGYEWRTNSWFFVLTLASACLFVMVHGLIPKLVSAMMLSAACGLTSVALAQCVAALPGTVKEQLVVRRAKPAQSPWLLSECSFLAMMMRVRLCAENPLKIVPGWMNACAMGRGVVVGQPIVDTFDNEALRGVLAHEVAHIKARHVINQMMAACLAYLLLARFVSIAGLPTLVDVIVMFSGVALTMSVVGWRCEYGADAVAAKYVGVDAMTAALRALGGHDDAQCRRDSWSHPSIVRRVARLQKMGAR